MAWVVRIAADTEAIERMTTAAIVADSTGCAEVNDPGSPGVVTLLVGFDSENGANAFAEDHPGAVVEPVDPSLWAVQDLAFFDTASGPIELEVGTAFGSGEHATTRLALDALSELGPGADRTLFDVGCGTGVLSIVGAKQGFVTSGCDIDTEAVAVAVRNAELNDVVDRVSFVVASPTSLATPRWLMRSAGFDAVIVNTLVGVHEAEGRAISALAGPDAPIIITGLQGPDQLDRAAAAYPEHKITQTHHDGPWTLAVLNGRGV